MIALVAMTALLALAALLTSPAPAQPRPSEPELGPVAPTAAGARAPVAVVFDADPRVELLSVLVMLARPDAFAERLGQSPPPYAARARKAFAPFARHPAVVRVRTFLDEEPGGELTEAFLALSPPPDLTAASGAAGRTQLLNDVRDFARRSRFAAFYKDNAAYYRELAAQARAEADRGLRPDSVTGYLRLSGAGAPWFILAPLLPGEMAANARIGDGPAARYLRVRPVRYAGGVPRMSFDVFAAGAAHDVGHALLDPLAAASRAALAESEGLMFDGCAGSWPGCVSEQVDLAVTLRALAAERGESVYGEMLRAYEWKYPALAPLCRRLKEWEARPEGPFADFYPRLTAVFREEAAKLRASAPDAAPPRPRRPR
jgi:hypothetical protein